MKRKTKKMTPRKLRLMAAEQDLREKAVIFQSELDVHIRRVIAKPKAVVILVNIVEMVGNADAAQIIHIGGPNPPGWEVKCLALGRLQIDMGT